MTNYDRYQQLLAKRDVIDKQTKVLEKEIFDLDTESSEKTIQNWARLELKRREIAVATARQWQTLSYDERKKETDKYAKR